MTAFKKFEVIWSGWPYYFKCFKGCLPQILFGPFLNTLHQIILALNFFTVIVSSHHSWFNLFFLSNLSHPGKKGQKQYNMVEIEASPLRYYYSVIQQSSLAICVKIHFCEKIWFKKNILLLSFFACSMKVWLPCNVVVKLFLALLLVEHGFPFFMKLLFFFFLILEITCLLYSNFALLF